MRHPLPQPFQGPFQQSTDGRRSAAETFSDLDDGQALPVLEDKGLRSGPAGRQARPTVWPARAGGLPAAANDPRRSQPQAKLGGRLRNRRVQRHLPADVTLPMCLCLYRICVFFLLFVWILRSHAARWESVTARQADSSCVCLCVCLCI